MTWREFKNHVERQGLTDDSELAYIDWSDPDDPDVGHDDENDNWSVH